MKQFIVGFIIAFFTCLSHAGGIEKENLKQFDSLSESSKAEIALAIAKAADKEKANVTIEPPPAVAKASQWATLGIDIGKALSGTAREMGVVVNEFIATPAGQWTVILIFWKILGHEIMHFFVGGMLFLVIIPCWIYFFRRITMIENITITPIEINGKIVNQKVINYGNAKYKDEMLGVQFWMGVGLAVFLIANTWFMV